MIATNKQKPLIVTILVSWIAGMTGSCSLKLQKLDTGAPAQILSIVGAPPVGDGRPRFRQIFCALLHGVPEGSSQTQSCESFLWRLGDEKPSAGSGGALPHHDPGLKIFIVPGAFNDCFPELGVPFQKGIDRLRGLGYRIDSIATEGRSGSERDGYLIAEALKQKMNRETDRLLFVGYSKGVTDILHFLVDFPDLARQVVAVISVSGAVNGSPLADKFAGLYEKWFADTLASKCHPGDKKVLISLERRVQMAWLASHSLPRHIAYFSLANFTDRPHVARILRTTYDQLAQIDPRNDGQLISSDQIIPGSTLLGFANTDHWDIALPVRQVYRFWGRPAHLPEFTEFPKDTLLEALVLFSIEHLERVPK
ncbi:MAG: hypothetical protein AMJ94_05935 [Deltaproteobacteria bacterium SM23_61]|nr:MAG: hypothetical protein AMJ94_05935 [Deltaproteobacteria bacterium SM23_61]